MAGVQHAVDQCSCTKMVHVLVHCGLPLATGSVIKQGSKEHLLESGILAKSYLPICLVHVHVDGGLGPGLDMPLSIYDSIRTRKHV